MSCWCFFRLFRTQFHATTYSGKEVLDDFGTQTQICNFSWFPLRTSSQRPNTRKKHPKVAHTRIRTCKHTVEAPKKPHTRTCTCNTKIIRCFFHVFLCTLEKIFLSTLHGRVWRVHVRVCGFLGACAGSLDPKGPFGITFSMKIMKIHKNLDFQKHKSPI